MAVSWGHVGCTKYPRTRARAKTHRDEQPVTVHSPLPPGRTKYEMRHSAVQESRAK